jgi:branched-chain amino acid transport system substrate-binding protein
MHVGTLRRKHAMSASVVLVSAGMILAGCGSSKSTSSATTAAPAAGSSTTAGSPATSAAPSGSVIPIGVIASLTGAQASSSDQAATVAPAWESYINASGGLNGHPVKVYVEDDKGDPASAQGAEQDLVGSKNVLALVVGSDNLVTAYDSDAISKGVAVVSGSANSTDWYTKAGMYPTSTGVLPGLGAQIGVAVKYAHAKKFANLYCSEVAACAQATPVLTGLAGKAGIGIVNLAVSSTAPSYTAQCLQLQQDGVDYAQLNFSSAAAIKFIQDCQAQNYNPTWGASSSSLDPGFDALSNITLYGPALGFPSVATGGGVDTFVAAMHKYAKDSNWHEASASLVWDGLQAVAKALAKAGASPTRQDVITGLNSFNGETLDGIVANPLTYTGKAVGFTFNPCYFVIGIAGGKTVAPAGLTAQCPTA